MPGSASDVGDAVFMAASVRQEAEGRRALDMRSDPLDGHSDGHARHKLGLQFGCAEEGWAYAYFARNILRQE